jgi:hypothetical protein
MDRKYIVGLIGAGLFVLAGAGVAMWLVGPEWLVPDTSQLSGDISSVGKSAGSESAGSESAGARSADPAEEQGPYEPTSQYLEPGFDPEVTSFAMGDSERPRDENLPEMLSGRAIQQVMNAHQQELVRCYADSLKADPDLAGRVFFDFSVAPDGHVAMVRVKSSKLRSKQTEDCFVDKAKHWTFPATRRDVLTRFDTDFNFVTQ